MLSTLNNLKYNNTDDLVEDILDISGKFKMFKTDYKISLSSNSLSFYALKDTTDETKKFKLNDSTNNRWIFMKGLGYWRFIYKTKSVQNKFFFFPTFSQLSGRKFILDDLFWLILLSVLYNFQ